MKSLRGDIEGCISDNPYVEGYMFEQDGAVQGYGMAAKSFSTEYGRQCIWLEDIYIKAEYRGLGIGSQFIDYITKKYPDALLRLEVEEENARAVHVYKKSGFEFFEYKEMKKRVRTTGISGFTENNPYCLICRERS